MVLEVCVASRTLAPGILVASSSHLNYGSARGCSDYASSCNHKISKTRVWNSSNSLAKSGSMSQELLCRIREPLSNSEANAVCGKKFEVISLGDEGGSRARFKTVLIARAGANEPKPRPPVFVLNAKPKPERRERYLDEGRRFLDDEDDGFADMAVDANHRSGYVALIGKPNVGKSTLLNQIIGQKLSIVTSKPQTTRHRILGICSAPKYQMILYDTPGIISNKKRKLDQLMMQNVRAARVNADCVLVIVDACQIPEKVIYALNDRNSEEIDKRPTLLVLNKKDLIRPGEIAQKHEWYVKYGGVDDVIPVSAKLGQGVDDVKKWLVARLPRGPAYYPKDIVSEHPERFFISEIVREKILIQYREEIPYVCQVNVTNYMARKAPHKDYIEIEIVVEKDTQMGVLLGKDGQAMKLLATASRLDIEEFIGKEVWVEIKVAVKGNWREDDVLLENYGYIRRNS